MGSQNSKDYATNYKSGSKFDEVINQDSESISSSSTSSKEAKKYRRYTIHHKTYNHDLNIDSSSGGGGSNNNNNNSVSKSSSSTTTENTLSQSTPSTTTTSQSHQHQHFTTSDKNNNINSNNNNNNNNNSTNNTNNNNNNNHINNNSKKSSNRREKSKTINLGNYNNNNSSATSIGNNTNNTSLNSITNSASSSTCNLTFDSSLSISSGLSAGTSYSSVDIALGKESSSSSLSNQHFNRTRSRSLNIYNNNNNNNTTLSSCMEEDNNKSKSTKKIKGTKSKSSTALFKSITLRGKKDKEKEKEKEKPTNNLKVSKEEEEGGGLPTVKEELKQEEKKQPSPTKFIPTVETNNHFIEEEEEVINVNDNLGLEPSSSSLSGEFKEEEYYHHHQNDYNYNSENNNYQYCYEYQDQEEQYQQQNQEEYFEEANSVYISPPPPNKKPPPLPPKNFKPKLSMDPMSPPQQHDPTLNTLSPLSRSSLLGRKLSSLFPPLEPSMPSPCSSQRSSIELNYLKEIQNYVLLEKIGSGTFSNVHLCSHKDHDSKRFAIKVIDKSLVQMIASHTDLDVTTEVNILKSLKHPNIIQLHDHFETENNYYIVMELLNGGELLYNIENNSSKQDQSSVNYTEDSARKIIKQIVHAIDFLHQQNVVHRDLKPENILFRDHSDFSTLKIIDFGLAAYYNNEPLVDVCGTPDFQAPEMIKRLGYSFPVDIWAIGVILYILLCGHPPFQAKNSIAVMALIMRAEIKFDQEVWSTISPLAKDLVIKMLEPDPSKRLTIQQILDHEWIKVEPTTETDSPRIGPQFHRHLRRYNSQRYFKQTGDAILKSQRYSIYAFPPPLSPIQTPLFNNGIGHLKLPNILDQ
ncbi:putative protein serine/threonine kinase [Cavenderia fasciculata]|uniref:non-specific serine/threonine protein kinase n=1 Tax=Cavenderia fasciculata TaxID=261658 RepID=F4PK34_CACFS|nr:putative protein serine/threonine kinase [Cavenderia fasciculata]EGG23958.1 putative protein serine/threonine kinase [Cavenderia fasciculata]|eukprot:XP_004361809.1 putative protein serine/threonine kinase [Cavenderia fasciculata]